MTSRRDSAVSTAAAPGQSTALLLRELDEAHGTIRHLREQCCAWQMRSMDLEAELRGAKRALHLLQAVHLPTMARSSSDAAIVAVLHEEAICRAAILAEAAQYCAKRALPPPHTLQLQRIDAAFDVTPAARSSYLTAAAVVAKHCAQMRATAVRAATALSRAPRANETHDGGGGDVDVSDTNNDADGAAAGASACPKAVAPQSSSSKLDAPRLRLDAACQTMPPREHHHRTTQDQLKRSGGVHQLAHHPLKSETQAQGTSTPQPSQHHHHHHANQHHEEDDDESTPPDHFSPNPAAPQHADAEADFSGQAASTAGLYAADEESSILRRQVALMQAEISSLLRMNERREDVASMLGRPSPTAMAVRTAARDFNNNGGGSTSSKPRGVIQRTKPLYPTAASVPMGATAGHVSTQTRRAVSPRGAARSGLDATLGAAGSGSSVVQGPPNLAVATIARDRFSLAVSRRSLSPESRVLLSGPL